MSENEKKEKACALHLYDTELLQIIPSFPILFADIKLC